MWKALRHSLRMLLRQPLITLVVVLSLAVGIGFNTAVFSFVHDILLDPFPAVREPGRLVAVYSQDANRPGQLPISYPNFEDYRDQNRVFSGLAAHQVIEVGLSTGSEPVKVYGEMVTANFFDVLGVGLAAGRSFRPDEDAEPGRDPVAILSYGFWQRRFGGHPDVLGSTIDLNGTPFTVIGVAAEGFKGTNAILSPVVWVPTMMYSRVFSFADAFEQRAGRVMHLVGRLKPGVSLETARGNLETIASRLERQYPDANRDQGVALVPFNVSAVPQDRRTIFVRSGVLVAAVVGVLLLIACVNVANVLLARTISRRKEIALRLSLGASKRRLFGLLLSENALIAVLAGAVGLALAGATRRVLWSLRPPYFSSRTLDAHLDGSVLVFTVAASALALALFGLAPILQSLRTDLAGTLKSDRGGERAGRRLPLRDISVFLQMALCMVGLASAGLFLASFHQAQQIDPGFASHDLVIASFDLQSRGYDEPSAKSFLDRLVERARSLPGVRSASVAENALLGGWRWYRVVYAPGEIRGSGHDGVRAGSTSVGDGYFSTVGIPIVHGRSFGPRDREDGRRVVIVNQTLARLIDPSGDPVGQFVHLDEDQDAVEVVGVARDAKYRTLGEDPQPFVYLPLAQSPSLRATLHVATRRPRDLIEPIRTSIRGLDRELPVSQLSTVDEVIGRSLWAPRLAAVVLSIFGAVALLLAAVGVYGVASFAVGRRRREIGIRLALGAHRRSVIRMVLGQEMRIVALGALCGALATLALSRWIGSVLYVAGTTRLVPLIWSGAVLVSIAFLATLLPAVRASRTDPVTVISSE